MILRSRSIQDPKKAAEEHVRKGDYRKAIEAYAKAGEWLKASKLAAESKDEEELVRCSLMAGMGRIPEGYANAGLGAAGELLASRRNHELAIPLFEAAWNLPSAAASALALNDPLRAARYFERAGDRLEAARCYQRAGKLKEALQQLEENPKSAGGMIQGRAEEITVLRLDLLRQLGRDGAAAALLGSIPPSPRVAALLEESGRLEEAIHCYLEIGDTAKAAKVAARCPDRDRQMARIHLRSGRAVEAGNLFAQIGQSREAAEAYEAGQDWARAAYRWEATGEPARAAEAYLKAGRPKDAARCFTAAGLPARAAELAERKAAREPQARSTGRAGKALSEASGLLSRGDKARAAAMLLQIQPGDPDFERSVLLVAPLLIEEGFHEELLRRLGQIQTGAERLFWEGRAREIQGDLDRAQRSYQQALAFDPSHPGARERMQRLSEPPPPPEPAPVAVTPLSTTATGAVAPGQRIAGRYDILGQLGRGGMGRVYKAQDLELGETVAIKTLLESSEEGSADEARLLREVQICRRITHPNVVRVYDIGRFPGGIFVTMEHLEGRSLDRVVAQDSPVPFERVRAILTDVAEGLHEAHLLGIVHRDLKPANIMVTETRAKILDFGIARVQGRRDPTLTQAGFVLGSPSYMSPDQLKGMELDGRSDLYSLGILAFTLIAGREPFESPDATVLALKQLQEKLPDIRTFRAETPAEWITFLETLTAKQRDERFQTAREVVDALRALPAPGPDAWTQAFEM